MTEIKDANNVRLFALNSNPVLAQAVADRIGLPLSKASVSHFADGEIKVSIDESVRGCEVYVIQSVSDPVNTNFMELMIMVDALRRASAASINVVMPYYGYARQDRKARSREPITAKLIANLLEMDRINRLISMLPKFRDSLISQWTTYRPLRSLLILSSNNILTMTWWSCHLIMLG